MVLATPVVMLASPQRDEIETVRQTVEFAEVVCT